MKEHLKEYIENSKTMSVRGLRILLEYFYATEIFEPIVRDDIKIISVFGSARSKDDTPEYRMAYRLGRGLYQKGFAVVTGGSCGIMEAANQGVADQIAHSLVEIGKATTVETARETAAYKKFLKKYSVGLKISLPFEPHNNPYVGVYANFHYFMVRKFFFGTLSSGFIACEGGWGTRDELFEILTLVQTGKAPLMPVIYVSSDPQHLLQDVAHTVKKGYIHEEDARLLEVVKDEKEALERICFFYKRLDRIEYLRGRIIRLYLKAPLPIKHRTAVMAKCNALSSKVGPYAFANHHIDFTNFPHQSYGYLRQIIDAINR